MLDYSYLESNSDLDILILHDSEVSYRTAYWNTYLERVNVIKFLEASGHNITIIPSISDIDTFQLSNFDGIVFANIQKDFTASVLDSVKQFANNGGRIVFLGENGIIAINEITESYYTVITRYYDPNTYRKLFIRPRGQTFSSTNTEDTIFSPYYWETHKKFLPMFGKYPSGVLNLNVFPEAEPYCSYIGKSYIYDSLVEYCGVWSKQYGNGDVTFLATRFDDR